jgi:hypothetical protein
MRITHSPRWLRGIAFTLVGLLSVFSFVTPSRTASADQGKGPCWTVWVRDSASGAWHRELRCNFMFVQKQFHHDGCEICGFMIDWRVLVSDPEWITRVDQGIADGLVTLGRAAATQNPADRAALRQQAMNSFGFAAYHLAGTRLDVNAVGAGDPDRNTFSPLNLTWLTAAARDVVAGVSSLQDGNPTAAAAKLDRAYAEISNQQVISG